ncbi:hypothetical protein KP509_28G000100 [Ceratopteris richardii]|uniref:Uncharacterized protein n=1 Tax=Ceratopteris richardii TaxID=49495 RepID=A0A8T2RBD2_CERRI|nr:hypothetical protein KP509_28G000100 [Ceratopteris richardii]
MGPGKGGRATEAAKRAFKTMFFMLFMLASLLVSCAPLLISVVDIAMPCILLSAFACCNSCFRGWTSYNLGSSVADIPLLSLIRSLAILCVYLLCGMPSLTYGLYVNTATVCGGVSALMLVMKTCAFFHHADGFIHTRHVSAVEALPVKKQAGLIICLFACSMALALGHIAVAIKVKSQAQRKMHIHRLDPEAVYGLNTFLYTTHEVSGKKQTRQLSI